MLLELRFFLHGEFFRSLGTLDGVGTWGTQTDGNVTMRSRIVFVEDGERLLHVVCMAPASLWDAVAPAFAQALATFTLRSPRGRTVELAPPDLPLTRHDRPPSVSSNSCADPISEAL